MVYLQSDVDQQKGNLDGDLVTGYGSYKRSDNKENESELSTILVLAENVPKDD